MDDTKPRRDLADDPAWQRLLDYGERRARSLGIRPEDVERLVDEYRAEVDASSGSTTSLLSRLEEPPWDSGCKSALARARTGVLR